MCGVVAIIPKYNTRGLNHNEMSVFETLVTLDTLRGDDSTGMFTATRTDVQIIKDAVTGPQFLRTKEYEDFKKDVLSTGKFVAAHNRKATRGTVNDKNAHPFWRDNKVVMIHNGTFIGDHKKHADTEVDSEALCHVLSEHEPDAVDSALDKISAAYALIWYDVRDNSLNLTRNSQRPMWIWETPNSWLVCSEYGMLAFAVGRERFFVEKDSRPDEVEEGHHYKFSFKENKTNLTKSKLSFRKDQDADWDLDNYYAKHYGQGYVPHNRRAAASAWTGTREIIENAATQVQQQKAQQPGSSSRKGSSVTIGDAIMDDSGGHLPEHQYSAFANYRELFAQGTVINFKGSNLVSKGDKSYLIYGQSETHDSIVVAAEINEEDFTRLIKLKSTQQMFQGRVKFAVFKNTIATTDITELRGPIIIEVSDIKSIEGETCAC